MGTPKKKRWRKITQGEHFSVFQSTTESRQFEVSWKKPSGGYGRRRYVAESPSQAIEAASEVAGWIRRMDDSGGRFTLLEAFEETLAQTSRGPRAKKDWLRDQLKFMQWVDRRCPDCTHWHLLTRSMLRAYMRETLSHCAPNRKRIALQPITQTANYMEHEYNMPNVARRLGIGSKLARPPAEVYLVDVVAFLDWLKDRDPILEVGAALQGLAGLQLQEALRLRWSRVDLERGLIEISGEVKNEYRTRVLPVCSRVLESLTRAAAELSGNRVQSVDESVVPMHRGGSYAESDHGWRRYSRAVSDRMKRWNRKIAWAPKDLRNCLPTFSTSAGIHSDVWEQYLGHAPKSVTGRHYIPRIGSASLGEAEALNRRMEVFRMQVVEPLENAINKGVSPNILNVFEREAPVKVRRAVDL